MHIIIGASGQVGAAVAAHLLEMEEPVKGIVRDMKKAPPLQAKGAVVEKADLQDLRALTRALQDGTTLFIITPEDMHSEDMMGDTQKLLDNYHKALEASSIKKVVGISSIGAQHEKGTGNLQQSYMLEHAFTDLPIEKIFIRPAYYLSNWLPYLPVMQETGKLPTFFPADMPLSMISPMDVAAFAADVLVGEHGITKVYELLGPAEYTANDVAEAFSQALGKPIKAHTIHRNQWKKELQQLHFTADAIKQFTCMTEAVINGRTALAGSGTAVVKGKTSLQQYIEEAVKVTV
ncbi:NAD(P)H-binding protein [Chitinophaga agrisoli]|uniref:NAD(P)H-binding protein n=1 Tax=Chitinophaga agrisoli TaxID=2607653 RepID=A0A5B2VWS8_9BACT|nr:NmrA family NAD(P)-binding protein [Chitinophaga agrisoli]KAA2243100.1 NAD(P)H-binding protein [Chitinophaga agrisoli]